MPRTASLLSLLLFVGLSAAISSGSLALNGESTHEILFSDGTPTNETILVNHIGGLTYSFQISEEAASVLWNFGDGSSLITTNSSAFHSYAQTGTYTLYAAVTDTNGHTIVLTRTLAVSQEPLQWGYAALGLTVVFLLSAIFIKNEPMKIVLAIFGLITLLLLMRPEFFRMSSTPVTAWPAVGHLTLALGVSGIIVSILPSKTHRARPTWFLFGVITLVLWVFLKGLR